jgi:transposase
MVLVWDNLNVRLRAELRAFTAAQPWLEVFQLPSYAPDLNPVEGIWSALKRGRWPTSPSPASPTCSRPSSTACGKSSTSLPSSTAASPEPGSASNQCDSQR